MVTKVPAMIGPEELPCTPNLGSEVLMVISSSITAIFLICFAVEEMRLVAISEQNVSFFLSTAYALFLPLMSYMFAQAEQFSSEGSRAQVILIWMVLIEIIRVRNDNTPTWELKKTAEQLVRLLWVASLVCGYTHVNGVRASLIFLCVFFAVYEVAKVIRCEKAQKSYLIGKNPKLIHNYVKRIMLRHDLNTMPMRRCDYIIMGEENHQIDVCNNGYVMGERKPDSKAMLTIGRVFELNSPGDKEFTLRRPNWRDKCLSLALAKMLRRRFAKLPLDEEGNNKALKFVLEGLIDYIDTDKFDIPRSLEGNQTERLFGIIEDELRYVSAFLHTKVPTYHYFARFRWFDMIGMLSTMSIGIYLIYTIFNSNSPWVPPSIAASDLHRYCRYFHSRRQVFMVFHVFFHLDQGITFFLLIACIYAQTIGLGWTNQHWKIFDDIGEYLSNPVEWNKKHDIPGTRRSKSPPSSRDILCNAFLLKCGHNLDSIFVLNVHGSKWSRFIEWLRSKIPLMAQNLLWKKTNAKQAVLRSLRNSNGQLTKGETSIRKHGMERLGWACRPNESITETILVWHIATVLFDHQTSLAHQQNMPLAKEREIATSLSNYCHYLVKCLPDLLQEEVEWINNTYEDVRKEISSIDRLVYHKLSIEERCRYALQTIQHEDSVVGKGVKLANDLIKDAKDGKQVWEMLADFWPEMILFVAASDNVEAHEKILYRREFVTQLWTLLSHAGIVTRPKHTEHYGHV